MDANDSAGIPSTKADKSVLGVGWMDGHDLPRSSAVGIKGSGLRKEPTTGSRTFSQSGAEKSASARMGDGIEIGVADATEILLRGSSSSWMSMGEGPEEEELEVLTSLEFAVSGLVRYGGGPELYLSSRSSR
jgi:hypothetical protein